MARVHYKGQLFSMEGKVALKVEYMSYEVNVRERGI